MWIVFYIVGDGFFIVCCQTFFGKVSILDLKGDNAEKIMLAISILTPHSFSEVLQVEVSFLVLQGLP